MQKRFLIVLITVFFLLLAIPMVDAGCGCPDEVDVVDISFNCSRLNIAWSHDSGIGSAILVVDYETLQVLAQEVFTKPSGNVSISFDPPLSENKAISFLIIVVDGATSYVSTADVYCQSTIIETCSDGRLTFTLCQPLVIYPVNSEDGTGLSIYLVSRGSDVGEFMLNLPAEVFDSLPDEVEQNCTIDSSEDGRVVAYLLSSGEYQINFGPDEEGKVFAYIFNDLNSAPVRIDTFMSGTRPEILPSCI